MLKITRQNKATIALIYWATLWYFIFCITPIMQMDHDVYTNPKI